MANQAANALCSATAGEPAPQPGPRLYHEPELPQFQALTRLLEQQWIELLRQRVGVTRERLPLLWDCGFMFGERASGEPERYVLCEINVSSVSPFPPSSIAPLVAATKARLGQRLNHVQILCIAIKRTLVTCRSWPPAGTGERLVWRCPGWKRVQRPSISRSI